VAQVVVNSGEVAPIEPTSTATISTATIPTATTPSTQAAGKLGLASKAQGFEDDQATQFFPDELEEAEFFIQQDLFDEARDILNGVQEDVPDSPRVQWMLLRIDAKEAGAPEPPAPWEKRILEEMAAQLADLDVLAPAVEPVGETQISVDEVLQQFKKGIAATVPEEDAATHYDLGCAYRDMGLLDEAVAEFRIAGRAPSRAVDAQYLIGVTLFEQGKFTDAAQALADALAMPVATRDQQAANQYQLGLVHEAQANELDALRAFKRAKVLGHTHVELERRIQTLVKKHGDVDVQSGGNGAGFGRGGTGSATPGKSKNIDYL
jgi:tetratricopeptide (TPR) repeat protein